MYSNSSDTTSRFSLPPLSRKEYYQKSTFYSYPDSHGLQEYYYPVYEWSEDPEKNEIPVVDQKTKKKKEMDERITEINREFLENRQVLYEEKVKQLQKELNEMEKGKNEKFEDRVKDLDKKRRETIYDAELMMIYQISTADKLYSLDFKKVQDESIAEQKEIQNALFSIIEEKRKKLKEDKDNCEGDLLKSQQHQTRNRKRLMRKRAELDPTPPILHLHQHQHHHHKKNKLDRQKECPSHLIGVLSHRVESDIDSDLYAMRKRLTF